RQPVAAAGAPAVAEDAPIIDEGGQANPAPELIRHPSRHLSSHLHHHQLTLRPCLRGWPD
ncbi:hypothetical protein Tco_1357791, partial [Tanacetum coccineum]